MAVWINRPYIYTQQTSKPNIRFMVKRQAIRGKYILSETALNKIKDIAIRRDIGVALNVGDATVIDYITKNSDNLTKVAALEVIRKKTDLLDDEILVDTTKTATKTPAVNKKTLVASTS